MDVPDPTPHERQNLVAIGDDALDLARRAMLDALGVSLGIASDQIRELRDEVWPPGVIACDCRATVRMLRHELDAMDALGWPRMER
jgi:hypothetical protein